MQRIAFEDAAPIVPSAPDRMDVALFVGFVRPRALSVLPSWLEAWLSQAGWIGAPFGRPAAALASDGLLEVPVPLESGPQFDALFNGGVRTAQGDDGSTYLAAAVRSFFAQGGSRCYVVRCGDPWRLEDPRTARMARLARLVPGYPLRLDASPADRSSWRGAGHLFGLPDVSLLCLPDLADAVATDREPIAVPRAPPGPREVFVECSEPLPPPRPDRTFRRVGAPRCDARSFADWSVAVEIVTDALRRHAREVQLVAALPLADGHGAVGTAPRSAFVQVAYPWVRTPGSEALPDLLESPDGVLAGILARNALSNGTHRSAAGLGLGDVYDLYPDLDREDQDRLAGSVSLFAETPSGLRLVSDATTSADEEYRPGMLSRLVAALARTARRVGADAAFESSGEALWADVRARLKAFLLRLFQQGVFRGNSPAEAFEVRCGRETMTQADIDAGRVVAEVRFAPVAPIEEITVVLVVNELGQSAAVSSEAA